MEKILITLRGETNLKQPLGIRLAVALIVVVGVIVPMLFFQPQKYVFFHPRILIVTSLFGGLAVALTDRRHKKKIKNPSLYRYLEWIALGMMFVPHLWLIRNGQAANMINVHPYESFVLPALILVAYYLKSIFWS